MPNRKKVDKSTPITLSLPLSQIAFLDRKAKSDSLAKGRSFAMQKLIAKMMADEEAEAAKPKKKGD